MRFAHGERVCEGNGRKKSHIYKAWAAMKSRCYRIGDKSYNYYGKRGIVVCDEWKDNFKVFRDWAFANNYRKGLLLDRIDNNKGYSPDNCRWVTHRYSAYNRRTNKLSLGKARKIRQLYNTGVFNRQELAFIYNEVTYSMIARVIAGDIWKG